MAAYLEREQIGIKETTQKTTVPNTPVAKLMYYFNCVCTCIDDSDDFRRLRCFQTLYNSLTEEEEAMLLVLCLALSPDKLINSVFFLNDEMGGTTNNRFFELSAVSTKLVVSQTLLVGGQQRRVHKIMMFKKCWIERNYFEPLKAYLENPNRGRRAALPAPPRQQRSAPVYTAPRPSPRSYRAPPPQQRNNSSCLIL